KPMVSMYFLSRSDENTGKDSSAQQTCIVFAPCFAAALALSNRLLLLCPRASEGANWLALKPKPEPLKLGSGLV
ncbi:MAG: hypothetical protein IKD96_00005, partial [Oscillospiraceae bacterium]|nr:hypothetical protein [Oscillospiraceae bacterium]